MTNFGFYSLDKQRFYEQFAREYKFDQIEPTPWKPIQKALKNCVLSLITTAGVRISSQQPFKIDPKRGSAEFKTIPFSIPKHELRIDFTLYDTTEAKKDINVIVPIDRILELVEKKVIQAVSNNFSSFVGFCTDIDGLKNSSKEVADKLLRENVDIVLVFTASHLCNQTASIICREIEKMGISTLCLATIQEVATEVKPPRSCFINFPFGMVLGRAFSLPLQRSIVNDLVNSLTIFDRPAKIIKLPYEWEGMAE